MEVAYEHENSLPTNPEEMGNLCFQVEQALSPISSRETDKAILRRIQKIRVAIRKEIIKKQQLENNWTTLEWKSREVTIDNVRKVVSSNLGLPKTAPVKDSEEWAKLRGKIVKIRAYDMRAWGLRKAFDPHKFFTSHIDILIAAFDESYEIMQEMSEIKEKRKKVNEWKSKKQTMEKVQAVIAEKLNLPATVPSRENDQETWQTNREKILSISIKEMENWKITGSYINNKWFASYIDVIIAIFDEDYDIKEEMEKKRHPQRFKTREMIIREATNIICGQLNLPKQAPPNNCPEWVKNRKKIIAICQNDMIEWGLDGAFHNNRWFSSYIDILIAIFDEDYNVKEELLKRRKNYKWTTERLTIDNVRTIVSEKLVIPAETPPKGSLEWERNRERIIQLNTADMREWRLRPAYEENRFFSSYRDVLIVAFPDYEIKRWMLEGIGRFVYRVTRNDPETTLITQEDLRMIEGVLLDDKETIDDLMRYCYGVPVQYSQLISPDDQKNQAFIDLLENIRIMGLECPINIKTLWYGANKRCRLVAYFNHLLAQRTTVHTDNIEFLDNIGTENSMITASGSYRPNPDAATSKIVDRITMERAFAILDDEEKEIIDQFLSGEITDIDDPKIRDIISKIKSTMQ